MEDNLEMTLIAWNSCWNDWNEIKVGRFYTCIVRVFHQDNSWVKINENPLDPLCWASFRWKKFMKCEGKRARVMLKKGNRYWNLPCSHPFVSYPGLEESVHEDPPQEQLQEASREASLVFIPDATFSSSDGSSLLSPLSSGDVDVWT